MSALREGEASAIGGNAPLPHLSADAAFFIDFDGTLVPIADRPDLVHVEDRVIGLLEGLRARSAGALAIITGRPLSAIDHYLAPLVLPVAAEHGAVRRDAGGALHVKHDPFESVAAASGRLEPLVQANAGLLLERKTSSVGLHFRQRPDLEALCAEAAFAALEDLSELTVQPGKMIFEIKLKGFDKGEAVRAFVEEAPFKGRLPVVIGDDLTDEYAFAAANALGGVSIKIGEGETVAQYRSTQEDFLAWADSIARESARLQP